MRMEGEDANIGRVTMGSLRSVKNQETQLFIYFCIPSIRARVSPLTPFGLRNACLVYAKRKIMNEPGKNFDSFLRPLTGTDLFTISETYTINWIRNRRRATRIKAIYVIS
jgi:hypothetical protein